MRPRGPALPLPTRAVLTGRALAVCDQTDVVPLVVRPLVAHRSMAGPALEMP
jgi:hypothetical protein